MFLLSNPVLTEARPFVTKKRNKRHKNGRLWKQKEAGQKRFNGEQGGHLNSETEGTSSLE